MPAAEILHGLHPGAALLRIRTARHEDAAVCVAPAFGHIAGYLAEPLVSDVRQRGYDTQERVGIGMGRRVKERLRRCCLDHASGIHDCAGGAVQTQHTEVMTYHQYRDAGFLMYFPEEIEDLALHDSVQRGSRLIRYQQLRLVHQRHRYIHTLAHAAGQLPCV